MSKHVNILGRSAKREKFNLFGEFEKGSIYRAVQSGLRHKVLLHCLQQAVLHENSLRFR